MKKSVIIWPSIVIGVVFLVTIAVIFKNSDHSPKGADTVRTAVIERRDVSDVLRLRGKVISIKKVPIFSEATGQVVKLYVEQGKAVEKGELLIEIDKKQLTNDIEKQNITVQKADISLKNAETDFKRKETLYAERFVSEMEFDAAKKAFDLARLDHSMATKEIEALTQQLEKVNVTAPISGIVTKKNVEEGEVVGSMSGGMQSKLLLEITDVSQKRIEIFLSEVDRTLVEIDKNVTFCIETDPAKRYEGRFVKIDDSPQQKDNVSQFRAEVDITDKNADFTLGVTVAVEVVVAQSPGVIAAPVDAIMGEGKTRFVYLKNKSGHEKRLVQTGISGADFVEITEGVKEGDEVFRDDPTQ